MPGCRRRPVAALVGAAVGAALAWVFPALPAGAALAVLAGLALALPVAPDLSTRLLFGLAVWFGAAPALWLVRVPWPRSALVAGLVAAGLLTWVLAGPRSGPPGVRVRRLVPRVAAADAALLVTAVGVVAFLWPTIGVRSAADELVMALTAWDSVAHTNMAAMIVHHGQLLPLVPPGSAGPWAFQSYPQGMHATAAALMELSVGVGGASPRATLSAAVSAQGTVYAASIVLVLAAVCSHPSIRRTPRRALLAALATAAVWLGSAGGVILHASGFDNFVLGVAATASLGLFIGRPAPAGALAPQIALAGLVLTVAHNWLLLLPIAAAAVFGLWLGWRGAARQPVAARRISAAIAIVTLVGVALAVLQVFADRGLGHVTIDGYFPTYHPTAYTLPVALGLLLAGGQAVRGWRRPGAPVAAALPVVVAVAEVGVLAAAQLLATGRVSYYSRKLLAGALLLTLTYAVVAAFGSRRTGRPAAAAVPAGSAPPRWVAAAGGGAVVLGLALPLLATGLPSPALGMRSGWDAPAAAPVLARGRHVEATLVPDLGARPAVFFVDDPSLTWPEFVQINFWQLALRGAWGSRIQRCVEGVPDPVPLDPQRLGTAVERVLGCDPAAVVVVPQRLQTDLQTRLPAARERILGG